MLRTTSLGSVEITSVDREALVRALRQSARRLENAETRIRQVRLFGSFHRGDYTPESDVDILIVVEADPVPFLARKDKYAPHFDALPLDVNILVYTTAEIERMLSSGNSFIREVLADSSRL